MAKKQVIMERVTLKNKEGATVSVWPVDVPGWKKHGYVPEGEEAPEISGEDMLKMSLEELEELIKKEGLNVKVASNNKIETVVNKILKAREEEDEGGAE